MKNKILIISLFVFFVTSLNAQVEGEVWYKPPFLPFSVSWGTQDGFCIRAERSINTPYGTFGLGASAGLSKKDENTVQVPLANNKPIYIEVPKYIERTKIVEKPVFQIRTVEKTITKIVENRTYIVEIRGYKGKSSQEFIIKGIDVFLVEVEGKTKIEAREGRIIIDVSESTVNKIMFRGSSLGSEDASDKIAKLCLKYNSAYNRIVTPKVKDVKEAYYVTENYQTDYGVRERRVKKEKVIGKEDYLEAYGFVVPSDYKSFEKYKSNFEGQRRLIVNYYIDNFNNSIIATYREMVLTKAGIGLPIEVPVYKKTIFGTEKLDYIKRQYKFFKWSEFIGITFNRTGYEGSAKKNQIFGHNTYTTSFEVDKSKVYLEDGFSNVEIIQFLKELNALLTSNME